LVLKPPTLTSGGPEYSAAAAAAAAMDGEVPPERLLGGDSPLPLPPGGPLEGSLAPLAATPGEDMLNPWRLPMCHQGGSRVARLSMFLEAKLDLK